MQLEFPEKAIAVKARRREEGEIDSRLRADDRRGGGFIERFDFDEVKPPLVVRPRRAGDRFVPLGAGAQKKVGKFLSDARAPQYLRRNILVVADSEKIMWVWPVRMCEQAKITGRTKKVLRLEITSAQEPGWE